MSKIPYQSVTLQALPEGGWELNGVYANTATSTQPAAKVGRPKGPDKLKKTVYISFGQPLFDQLKLDLATNCRILCKDDSDLIDFGLALLRTLAADPAKTEYLKAFNKRRRG